MIKFGKALRRSYAQINQPNKIRWTMLWLDEEGVYQPQTAPMKCRDFFNDLVAARKGQYFTVYGFKNQEVKFNDDYIHFRLTNLNPSLKENIDAWLNAEVVTKFGTPILYKKTRSGQAVVSLPIGCLDKTYYISLLTFLIRGSNYGVVFNSFKDFFTRKDGDFYMTELRRTCSDTTIERVLHHKFNIPEQLNDYWFYAGGSHSNNLSNTTYYFASCVHNNGWLNWISQKAFAKE